MHTIILNCSTVVIDQFFDQINPRLSDRAVLVDQRVVELGDGQQRRYPDAGELPGKWLSAP